MFPTRCRYDPLVRGFTRFVAWVVVIGGAIGLLLYLFVFDTWVVPGTDPLFTVSVLPTLAPEDRLLIRRETPPVYGQLARCVHPLEPNKFVVGRVFGMNGDQVTVRAESVGINGQFIGPRHACKPMDLVHPATGQLVKLNCGVEESGAWSYETLRASEFAEGDASARVEPGQLFLVSDDRHLH